MWVCVCECICMWECMWECVCACFCVGEDWRDKTKVRKAILMVTEGWWQWRWQEGVCWAKCHHPCPQRIPHSLKQKRNSVLSACGRHILPKFQLGILNVFFHRILLKVVKLFSFLYIIYLINGILHKHCFTLNFQ